MKDVKVFFKKKCINEILVWFSEKRKIWNTSKVSSYISEIEVTDKRNLNVINLVEIAQTVPTTDRVELIIIIFRDDIFLLRST